MSSTISTISSGASSALNASLNFGSQAAIACKSFALASGQYFVTYVNNPASSVIGSVIAKANALGSPLLGPAAAVLVTGITAFTANRLFHHKTHESETFPYAKVAIKVIAVVAAILAGCFTAATVSAFSAAIPVYAAYALGAAVAGAALFVNCCAKKAEEKKDEEKKNEKAGDKPAAPAVEGTPAVTTADGKPAAVTTTDPKPAAVDVKPAAVLTPAATDAKPAAALTLTPAAADLKPAAVTPAK